MANQLAHSTSPYLQQHADNPVDWREWSPETLALARESDKPILLSIGYSACHWCHVMAHESFEDDGIAALMNRLYVNIKVDREERPDIDQIYQLAHAIMTRRSGGWPLTMFLTPDTTPFYGGTYFPKTPRHGLPGFGDLLVRVEQLYRERPDAIREQSAQLRAFLEQGETNSGPGPQLSGAGQGHREAAPMPSAAALGAARNALVASFEPRYGGFGHAPKFPHPEMIEFALRRSAANADAEARHVACHTLEHMCRGGIFDQLGGGFARYSTDETWTIPHFEKMLYDNGPVLRLLADAWLVAETPSQKTLFGRSAQMTAEWVMREMQSPAGGYYSTLDADSEGHEGKFYVWTRDEVESLLTPDEWRVARLRYGLDRPPNFEGHAWHLVLEATIPDIAGHLGLSEDACAALAESARRKLFDARERRVHPGRDEKVLTSWNALMIEGMAHASRVFDRPEWLDSARRALEFVRGTMWNPRTKRLFATHKDGTTRLNAYLDDYAYLLKTLLAVMQADFRVDDLDFARALAGVLLEQFADAARGGFYFTSHDHETLIQRPKPGFDNAMPSGNGVAAFALQRLSHLAEADAGPAYREAVEATLRFFGDSIAQHPSGHCSLLMALEEWLEPTRIVILAGPAERLPEWQRVAASRYLPATMTLAIANGTAGLPEMLRRPATDDVAAYICAGTSCLPAIADPAVLDTNLGPGP
jgi:uncharacterized protein YyaL (SSP411 family)